MEFEFWEIHVANTERFLPNMPSGYRRVLVIRRWQQRQPKRGMLEIMLPGTLETQTLSEDDFAKIKVRQLESGNDYDPDQILLQVMDKIQTVQAYGWQRPWVRINAWLDPLVT